jgi:hypothetical protein
MVVPRFCPMKIPPEIPEEPELVINDDFSTSPSQGRRNWQH